jgi:hypothetical protein
VKASAPIRVDAPHTRRWRPSSVLGHSGRSSARRMISRFGLSSCRKEAPMGWLATTPRQAPSARLSERGGHRPSRCRLHRSSTASGPPPTTAPSRRSGFAPGRRLRSDRAGRRPHSRPGRRGVYGKPWRRVPRTSQPGMGPCAHPESPGQRSNAEASLALFGGYRVPQLHRHHRAVGSVVVDACYFRAPTLVGIYTLGLRAQETSRPERAETEPIGRRTSPCISRCIIHRGLRKHEVHTSGECTRTVLCRSHSGQHGSCATSRSKLQKHGRK